MKRAVSFLAIALACSLSLSGCGGATGAQPEPSASSVSSVPSKLAANVSERIRTLMEEESDSISTAQRQILERTLGNDGAVGIADYETAWSNYRQCVVDKGYAEPIYAKYSNGLYGSSTNADLSRMTDAERSKFSVDWEECWNREVGIVQDAFMLQSGNPELNGDSGAATVDCLRRADLVDASYSKKRYEEEYEAFTDAQAGFFEQDSEGALAQAYQLAKSEFSFDMDNPDARVCVASNGIDIAAEAGELETYYPLG